MVPRTLKPNGSNGLTVDHGKIVFGRFMSSGRLCVSTLICSSIRFAANPLEIVDPHLERFSMVSDNLAT